MAPFVALPHVAPFLCVAPLAAVVAVAPLVFIAPLAFLAPINEEGQPSQDFQSYLNQMIGELQDIYFDS
jgi:hypothetical protein